MKLEEQISDNENLRNKYVVFFVFFLVVKNSKLKGHMMWRYDLQKETRIYYFLNIFSFVFIIGTTQQEICVIFLKTPLSGQLKKYIYVSVFF